jgi:hypothetical protein
MGRFTKTLAVAALAAALGALTGCRRDRAVGIEDLLGAWKVTSWVSGDPSFYGCDMKGTLAFVHVHSDDWDGITVTHSYVRSGNAASAMGYAFLTHPNRIRFEISYSNPYATVEFDGFIENGGMIGRLGTRWAGLVSYGKNTCLEAVKKD